MATDAAPTGGPPRRSLVARLLALPIVAYRRWVSPALPARCRFHPSCSAYALEALATHGAIRGTALTVWRLLRCQPFHPGGYDPVPERLGGSGRGARTDGGRCADSPPSDSFAAPVSRRGTPALEHRHGDENPCPPTDASGAATWTRS